VFLTPMQTAHEQAGLYSSLRAQLAAQTAPLGGSIAPGSPVALLTVPAIGLTNAVVIEGTAAGDLEAGVGHRRDTPLPGQSGDSVLYGRATLFGGPFGALARIKVGDTITATTGQGVFSYTVSGLRQGGDNLPPALALGGGRLTLVTGSHLGFAGLSARGLLYIDAALKGTGLATLPGRPAAVPLSEQALQVDPNGLLPLALALPLLIAIAALVVWAWFRWGRWQTWLLGLPLVLAGLWLASESAIRLLPNLL